MLRGLIHCALRFPLVVALLALVILHTAAALKHHVKDGNDVLKRMLPWTKLRT